MGSRTPPKFRLSFGPHSPFAAGLLRSQSGRKLLFTSFHDLVADVAAAACAGLPDLASPVATPSRYLPRLNLTAVCAVPNTSYETPNRGVKSFQFGTFTRAGKSRGPANCVAGN